MSDDHPDLGMCCHCLARPATGIMPLPRRAPTPGTGWGCIVCGLPHYGAIAVLCDECGDRLGKCGGFPRYVCGSWPNRPERVPYDALGEPFEHDPTAHMRDENLWQ